MPEKPRAVEAEMPVSRCTAARGRARPPTKPLFNPPCESCRTTCSPRHRVRRAQRAAGFGHGQLAGNGTGRAGL